MIKAGEGGTADEVLHKMIDDKSVSTVPNVPTVAVEKKLKRKPGPRRFPCRRCGKTVCQHCRCTGFPGCKHEGDCNNGRYRHRLVCNPCEKRRGLQSSTRKNSRKNKLIALPTKTSPEVTERFKQLEEYLNVLQQKHERLEQEFAGQKKKMNSNTKNFIVLEKQLRTQIYQLQKAQEKNAKMFREQQQLIAKLRLGNYKQDDSLQPPTKRARSMDKKKNKAAEDEFTVWQISNENLFFMASQSPADVCRMVSDFYECYMNFCENEIQGCSNPVKSTQNTDIPSTSLMNLDKISNAAIEMIDFSTRLYDTNMISTSYWQLLTKCITMKQGVCWKKVATDSIKSWYSRLRVLLNTTKKKSYQDKSCLLPKQICPISNKSNFLGMSTTSGEPFQTSVQSEREKQILTLNKLARKLSSDSLLKKMDSALSEAKANNGLLPLSYDCTRYDCKFIDPPHNYPIQSESGIATNNSFLNPSIQTESGIAMNNSLLNPSMHLDVGINMNNATNSESSAMKMYSRELDYISNIECDSIVEI